MYTRTRVQGGHTFSTKTYTQTLIAFNGNRSVSSPYNRGYPVVGGKWKMFRDREVPSFKKRSARGETFVNPMYMDETVVLSMASQPSNGSRASALYPGESTQSWKAVERTDLFAAYGFQAGDSNSPFATDSELHTILKRNAESRDVAWNRALQNMAQTDAMLLVTIAEARKTLALVGSYVRRFDQLFKPLTKLQRRLEAERGRLTSAEIVEQMSAEWLRIRYGVLTTVYEVEGVLKALQRPEHPPRITARGSSSYSDMLYVSKTNASSGIYPSQSYLREVTANGWVRAGVLYVPDLGLDKHLGVHWSSVPTSAFELIRFSFVLNWFIDLQEFLTALTARAHGTPLGAWITEELLLITTQFIDVPAQTVNATVSVGGLQRPVQWQYHAASAALVTSRRVRTRVRVDSLAPASPSIRVNLTPARVVDALALLLGNLKRNGQSIRI